MHYKIIRQSQEKEKEVLAKLLKMSNKLSNKSISNLFKVKFIKVILTRIKIY